MGNINRFTGQYWESLGGHSKQNLHKYIIINYTNKSSLPYCIQNTHTVKHNLEQKHFVMICFRNI